MPLSDVARIRVLRRRWSYVWRSLIVSTVFGCGLAAFLLGADASDRRGIADADLLTQAYYSLGLFVLGGLDLGTPAGGPLLARTLLWFTYFAAPALTAAAAIEGILRSIDPGRWRLRRLRGHIIVAGAGRLSMLYLERLRQLRPYAQVVLVELRPDKPAAVVAQEAYRARVITGDISSDAVLASLALDRAAGVVLLTSDDYVNLEAAAKILARAPALGPTVVVHVADLRFMRQMQHTRVARECAVFNSHQIAATHLVSSRLLQHFSETAGRDVVVLAGFGRFGQTVLDELQKNAAGTFRAVILIDHDAEIRALVYDEQVGFTGDYQRLVLQGDLRDPRIWHRVEADYDLATIAPVLIFGCGEDNVNLRTAVWAAGRYPGALIVARRYGRSSFAEEMAREVDFESFSVADLVTESMPVRWFGQS